MHYRHMFLLDFMPVISLVYFSKKLLFGKKKVVVKIRYYQSVLKVTPS